MARIDFIQQQYCNARMMEILFLPMWWKCLSLRIWPILIICAIYFRLNIHANTIVRVQNLSKLYNSRWFFQRNSYIYALNNITTIIPRNKIISFIGPSGSGKSTLVKCLVGMESINSGTIIKTTTTTLSEKRDGYSENVEDNSEMSYCYLDPHFYLSYNDNAHVHELLKQCSNNPFYVNGMVDAIFAQLKLPTDVAISSLLISQRKTFEILLGLCRIASNPPYALVFDEYFDKDHSTVLNTVMNNIKVIKDDFNINIQIFIVTHSKSVYQQHSDHTISLYKGMIYDSGPPTRVKCPAQITWVD